jgi:uncharacterized membrane protein
MRRPIAWRPLTSPSWVAGASALSLALLLARQAVATDRDLWWMAWNLFLAWTPVALGWLALALTRASDSRAAVLVAGLAWLLFLPNAPYLVTDLVHLDGRRDGIPSLDLVMLAAFAITGLLAFVATVRTMRATVALAFGRRAARAVVPVAVWSSAVGIYMGRVLRWNSWDLPDDPAGRLLGLVDRADTAGVLAGLAFTLVAGGFLHAVWSILVPPSRPSRD